MFGSKLSAWWHKMVDELDATPETKQFLHAYGMLLVWGGMIVGGIVLLIVLFSAAVSMRPH